MAATVVFDATPITDGETTTGWDNDTIAAVALDGTQFVQGNNSIATQASNKDGWIWFDYSGVGSFDFTAGDAGKHVFFWVNCNTMGIVDVLSTGGLYLMLGSDDVNFNCYTIGAGDALDVYPGGWRRFAIDPRKLPTFIEGAGADETTISRFGVGIFTNASARADNLFIDRIDVGYGLRVYGTSTNGWDDVWSADMGTNANVYGILQEKDGIYYSYGPLEIGDNVGTNGTTFSDTDRIIRFVSQEFYNGTIWEDAIGDDFFSLKVVGNSTNPTSFTDGIIVGSGDDARGRNASVFLGSDLHTTEVDLYDGSHADNDVNLYGTTFRYMYGGVTWGNDADHVYYGGTIDQCGQFDPVGAPIIRNCTFSGTTHLGTGTVSGSSLLWNDSINLKYCSFIANISSPSGMHAITHPSSGTYEYVNLTFAGNDYDILFSYTPSATLTINATNSNPTTYETSGAVGNTVVINNTRTLTLTDIVSASEVRIYDTGTQTEVAGIENTVAVSGTQYAYTYNFSKAGEGVDIVVHHVDYEYYRLVNYILSTTSTSLPIQQRFDRNYSNPT